MLYVRRITFYAFLITYLASAPLLILYSLGYIFNPLKSELTQTGLVYISSLPSGADIFLSRSRFTHKTPATIQELLPGSYSLRLSRRGYKPWKHTVTVEAGRAHTFENILLVPYSWHKQRLANESFKALLPLGGTDFFLAATGQNLGDYSVFDVKREVIKDLLPRGSPFFSFPVSYIYMQENSSQSIIYGGPLLEKKYLAVEGLKDKIIIKDITRLLSGRPLHLSWDPDEPTDVFAAYENHIDLLDLKTLAVYPQFLKNIRGYGVYNKWLYFIDVNGQIMRLSFDKKRQENFVQDPLFAEAISEKPDFYQMRLLRNEAILFISNRGRLWINLKPYQFEEEGVIGIAFNKPQTALAYWTRRKIAIARLSEDGERSLVSGRGFSVQVMYEDGRQIAQCLWLDRTHIIFRDGVEVSLLEIEPQGRPHIEPLVTLRSGTSVFYSDTSGWLYYLDRKNGNLCKIKIMDKL